MSTLPWSSTVPKLLDGDVEFITRAYIYWPSAPQAPTVLDVLDGALTVDESWAPYGQASMQCRAPAGTTIDARDYPRVGIDAGYRLADGTEDVAFLADLGVTSARQDVRTGTWTLDLDTDEALVQESAQYLVGTITNNYTSYGSALVDLISRGLNGYTPSIVNTLGSATGASMTGYQIQPGDDWWTHISSVKDMANAYAYCNLDRIWTLRPQPSGDIVDTGVELTIATGDAPTDPTIFTPGNPAGGVMRGIIEAENDYDRSDWANVVTGRWEWRNASGTQQTIGGRAPLTAPVGAKKVLHITRSTPITQTEANNACAAILARTLRRGNQKQVTTRNAYWLRPRGTVRLWIDGAWDYWIVRQVTWSLGPSGRMSLTLRTPAL